MRFVLIVGLLTGLFLLFPSSPAHASSLSSTFYTYDNLGNIQTMNNTVDTAKSVSYSYDDIYRLERVSGGYSSNYIYDADGNILTKNEDQNLTLTYIPSDSVASHGPKSVNGRLLRYDPNGNLIEDAFSNLKIVYDYDNRPVEIRKLDTNVLMAKYFYDGEGKRVKKEVYANNTLSKTTEYINQYYEKEQPVGGTLVVRKFYSGAAYRESQLTTNNQQLTTLYYTTTDHLSSTTLTTNTQGQKIAHYVYYPYGSPNLQLTTNLPAMLRPLAAMQRLRASIAMQAGNSQPLPNSWIGQKRDIESNLYFLNARYYSPSYGRFVSVDPARDSNQRSNNYQYAGNNPIIKSDPNGLRACENDDCTGPEETMNEIIDKNLDSVSTLTINPNFFYEQPADNGWVYDKNDYGIAKKSQYPNGRGWIDFTKKLEVKNFLHGFGSQLLSPDKKETINNISNRYYLNQKNKQLPNYNSPPTYYRGACMGDSMDTMVALKGLANIDTVFVDVKIYSSQSHPGHSVLAAKIDNEWYIIDNDFAGGVSPIFKTVDQYASDIMKNNPSVDMTPQFILPRDGDPFGISNQSGTDWLIKPH